MNRYTAIKNCRICGNAGLVKLVDLGEQTLTGVFPKNVNAEITRGPLHLVKCHGQKECCGLLQMAHTYDLSEMYGLNYGYRSGLNASMVKHLKQKVDRIRSLVSLDKGDVVVDIGSNDCTTLKFYNDLGVNAVGIDPTGVKFKSFYPDHIKLIPDFFTSSLYKKLYGSKKAKVVTSFSMFYDLEAPLKFAQEVAEILADDGIWVFEQSYMPTMLKMNSYDTACHEHLEYYGLKQIKWITDRSDLKIIDVEFNEVNGGSFSVTATKTSNPRAEASVVKDILAQEEALGLDTVEPYAAFQKRAEESKRELLTFLKDAKAKNKKVAALGASTKGNVLLQYCDITSDLVFAVGEVNEEKFNCYTPGTLLPIVPEDLLLKEKPDYLLVLPWHFRNFFEGNAKFKDTKLVFPLPTLAII